MRTLRTKHIGHDKGNRNEYPLQRISSEEVTDTYMSGCSAIRRSLVIPVCGINGIRLFVHQNGSKMFSLCHLETRRLRGDQIEVFKILNGYANIDSNIFFEIKESKITRGHNYTLVKKQSRLDVRKYSFSQRPSMLE